MRLIVYCSFEPAALAHVLAFWDQRVPLFTRIEVERPEKLDWGLATPAAADELRVFVLDGASRALEGALPEALRGSGTRPIVVSVPCADGRQLILPKDATADTLDGATIFADAELSRPYDDEAHALAGVPYSDSAYVALATALYRRAHARLVPEPKVIAVDCDNTLWRGLCAEMGPTGIVLGDDELRLHAFLRAQKQAGRLLALVSKNVPDDVEAVFATRSDLGLARADFVAAKIGWQPKSVALRELAAELSLGLDAFVFIDDSPVECAEVRAALPEVAVVRRPEALATRTLAATWTLDLRGEATGTLGEQRTQLYRQEAERRAALRKAPSFAEHVLHLGVRTEVRLATAEDVPRLFELAQRTNQFNTRSARPSRDQVAADVASRKAFAVHVSDRFGDYGLSGAVFVERDGDEARIERWLLSCRVLGRGVEADVFDAVAELARRGGASRLGLPCEHTARNLPARRYVDAVAAGLSGEVQSTPVPGVVVNLVPARPAPRIVEAPENGDGGDTRHRSERSAPEWTEVATYTRDPQAVVALLGLTADGPTASASADDASVLAILAEVMGRPVGRDDNLYALGADSLRLLRLLARLRGRLGLELPVGDLLYRADVSHVLELAANARSGKTGASDMVDEAFIAGFMRELRDEPEP